VVIWLNPAAAQWSLWSLQERLINLTTIIFFAAVSYFLLLWLQGLRPDQLKNPAAN